MKKISIYLIAFTIFSINCFGQKKKYYQKNSDSLLQLINLKEPRFIFNIHNGFAIGLGSTFKYYPDDISSISVIDNGTNNPDITTTYGNPTKGLGDGYRIGGGISYILNDFINIGLDVDYFKSTIKKSRDSNYTLIAANARVGTGTGPSSLYNYKETSTISYVAKLITFSPNITFKAISRPKWFIYNKVGAIITFRPNSMQNETTEVFTKDMQSAVSDSSARIFKQYKWQFKNPALGFMGALGMQVKLGDGIRAFAEAQFSHVVFVASKRSLNSYLINNNELKNTLPVSMRELEFVKTYTTNNNTLDPDMPSQTLTQRIPITYVGVQFGLAFQF